MAEPLQLWAGRRMSVSSTRKPQQGDIMDTDARRAYRTVNAAIVALGNLTDHAYCNQVGGAHDYQYAFLAEKVRDHLHDAKLLLEEHLTHGN